MTVAIGPCKHSCTGVMCERSRRVQRIADERGIMNFNAYYLADSGNAWAVLKGLIDVGAEFVIVKLNGWQSCSFVQLIVKLGAVKEKVGP